MSRIGNKIIEVPAGVTVTYNNHVATIKGPKGELKQTLKEGFDLKIEGDKISVIRPSDEKQDRALHGLYRSLIHNNIVGVSQGHTITQEFVGVGYRAVAQGQILDMSLGYSHKIMFELPKEIKIKSESPKGAAPYITMECADKELLGRVAAKIRSFRPPEPYKGKGIRFAGEQIRRKAGKSAAKK
ncbi:MAG: 50S ribosomal protein L6 [Bacteroidetes bacterium]|nr:50S ribosomal protein L6 [Bacteroidota bacterium]